MCTLRCRLDVQVSAQQKACSLFLAAHCVQRFRPPHPNTCRFSLWFSQQVVILQAAKGRMVKAKHWFSKLGN